MLIPVGEFNSIRGKGVEVKVDGKDVVVGKNELFQKIPDKVLDKARELQAQGKTTVMLGVGKEVVGLVALKDRVKDAAAGAIEELKARAIQSVIISGDNEATTASLAKEVGVDHYHAELLPEDKLEEISHLTEKYAASLWWATGSTTRPLSLKRTWA